MIRVLTMLQYHCEILEVVAYDLVHISMITEAIVSISTRQQLCHDYIS